MILKQRPTKSSQSSAIEFIVYSANSADFVEFEEVDKSKDVEQSISSAKFILNLIANSINFEGVESSKRNMQASNTKNSTKVTFIEPAILDKLRS